MDVEKRDASLTRNLSAAGAWAFAIGTSIGWGSLVVTNNVYLKQAGPFGSVLGMLIGMAVMLLISKNYAYLMNAYPDVGGAYAYSREIFGYDHGFLTSWFLNLTYFAMLWANATSLPLFARYFLGGVFHFGKLYTLFGYEVYFGEALLSIAAILLVALLCARFKRAVTGMMLVMASLFTIAITVCFVGAITQHRMPISPGLLPDRSAFGQVVKIACVSPWAFIGFESISHSVEEFSFRRSKVFRVLVVAVVSTTLLYFFVMLLSVTAYPPEYASWLEYMQDLDNLDGIRGLPAFYAANHYLGEFGVTALMISLLCLIFTSLIGNITALSRLFYALGKDKILPRRFGRLNRFGVPGAAIALIAAISILVPFVGRNAIGWIVDVTTLGATLIYGYVSAASMQLARKREDRSEKVTGFLGLVFAVLIGLYILIPNLFTAGTMETESYFLFVVWAVIGFIFFRLILGRDDSKRFGQSIIVWIALLLLVLFVSLVWMSQSIMDVTEMNGANCYSEAGFIGAQADMISAQMRLIRQTTSRSALVIASLFVISLGMLLNNYSLMSKRARMTEEQLARIRELASKDPMTGVKSKHAYAEREKEIDERIRLKTMEAFSLVLCDVNGLKYINDTYGHKAGDEYIRKACHMICTFYTHSPVFRIGGDEFLVILTGNDYERREEILQSLRSCSSGHIHTEEAVVASGMSDYIPGVSDNFHNVFEKADAEMYENKKALKQMGARFR